ncbi:hypothetical protein V492_00285 [Pseudogymnoascus sp. VKM F-4246]|nr:hypothetical protein V492_00285 [Pseudogymnoascus sp. VKM F-4246]
MDEFSEPPSSPRSFPNMAGARKLIRKCERYCCMTFTYFPLAFVYSITTWAVWVEASIGFNPSQSPWIGSGTSFLGIALYILLNWSYTTAVFTSPGSTTDLNNGYSSLPTQTAPAATSFTVKSTGELRFCKKCQARKPDRAHHCSTCNRCVLKMDHHCPWLATCVGLKNYKAFLLFLSYTTIFCFVCFGVSATWLWTEILRDGQYEETLTPINYMMLAVISGMIGLVLAFFTGWHIMLASRGQTTIECLEKTRYLSPVRRAMQHQHIAQHRSHEPPSYGQQLRDIHTNALPGVTRPEEGATPPAENRYRTYEDLERQRARDRYQEYLDEQDADKLPNAFDLGWRRNLHVLFGPKKLLWFVPVCNSLGDGWSWEPSPKWIAMRECIRKERDEQLERERNAGWGTASGGWEGEPEPVQITRHYLNAPSPTISTGQRSPSKADRVLGRDPGSFLEEPNDGHNMRMEDLSRDRIGKDDDDYDTSSDEMETPRPGLVQHFSGFGAQRTFGGMKMGLGQARKPQGDEEDGDSVD